MAVPKKRTSHSKRNMRRSHHAWTRVGFIICSDCGETRMRHHSCPACGTYRGRKVVKVGDLIETKG
ncbi:MAG TPA: 50S ribosomal protein L32 [Oligoflexia bacterium]|nr:50S ribosomal protein L32 [Oligoflexia bacterium]HMP27219.1 50S ribosomal protein L32 [Oligoflexia bacterium]